MGDTLSRDILGLTATIVAAHVRHNEMATDALPGLIQSVYRSLVTAGSPDTMSPAALIPAVPIKRSVFPDYIVCLENGKKLKTLKRHLNVSFGLTPAEYRAKWDLPPDYPMVAPNYAATRASMAKDIGFGRKRSDEPETPKAPERAEPEVTMVPARRARGSRG